MRCPVFALNVGSLRCRYLSGVGCRADLPGYRENNTHDPRAMIEAAPHLPILVSALRTLTMFVARQCGDVGRHVSLEAASQRAQRRLDMQEPALLQVKFEGPSSASSLPSVARLRRRSSARCSAGSSPLATSPA